MPAQPVEWSERNGVRFHYLVGYQRRDIPSAVEDLRRVSKWNQSELVVNKQEPFKPYLVHVKAVNEEGEAREAIVRRLVYSGEAGESESVNVFEPTILKYNG